MGRVKQRFIGFVFVFYAYHMIGDRGCWCGLVWFGKTFFKSFAFAFLFVFLVYNILLIVLHYNLHFLYLFFG